MAALDVDTAEYQAFAKKLKTVDRKLRNATRKTLRDLAKPLAEEVREKGTDPMPSRGGLRANLHTAKISVSVNAAGVSLLLGGRKHRGGEGQLVQIDSSGILRHPVYARGGDRKGWAWTTQSVPQGTYTKAFQEKRDEVGEALGRSIEQVIRETL